MAKNTIQITEEDIGLDISKMMTSRGFITGIQGSGKSNSLSVICEKILDEGFPVFIIDNSSEYWSLKEKYEVLHLGSSEECDISVSKEHAEKIASMGIEENIPIVLDISGFLEAEEADELIAEVFKHMYNKAKKLRKPYPIFVDEAVNFIPQNESITEAGRWIIKISKEARKWGLGMICAGQRPATINKNFVTQTDWRIWHRFTYNTDFKYIKNNLEKDYDWETIKNLNNGEAILDGTFLDLKPTKVKILQKKTPDLGKTPDIDQSFQLENLQTVSSDIISQFEEVTKKREEKQNKLEKLENQVEKLKTKNEDLKDELEKAKDVSEFADKLMEAISSSTGNSTEIKKRVSEIKEDKEDEIRQLRKQLKSSEDKIEELEKEKEKLNEKVDELKKYKEMKEKVDRWENRMDEAREAVSRLSEVLGIETTDQNEQLKKKIEQQKNKIKELKNRDDKISLGEEFEDALDFLHNGRVQDEIEALMDKTKHKEKHAYDILTVLADKEEAQIEEIEPFVDISESSIGRILPQLQKHNIVKKEKKGHKNYYSIDTSNLEELIKMQKRRERMDELKEEVVPGGK